MWCEDVSNQSCEIPRNLVRNRLLPQLETAWGEAFRANLCRSADILRSDDAFLEQLIIRRELSLNACWFNPGYDRYDTLPAWARATLDRHRRDRRL